MRYLAVLFLALLLAGCVPGQDTSPSLHDVSIYGFSGNTLYGYFYGVPTTVTIGESSFALTEGRSDDALAVSGTLLVDGQPYLRQGLEPLTETPFEVQRVPLSTDLTLSSNAALEAVVYFDGSLWFTLAEDVEAGFDARIVPKERIDGLRGLGQLTQNEARVIQRELEGSGPLALAVLSEPPTEARQIEGLKEYFRTFLVVQQGIPTNITAFEPPVRELLWDVLASGNQAVTGESPQFVIAANQSQLLNLWNQAYGNRLTPPPLPDIDFRRETVVAMFMGTKPTGGYGLDVRGVSLDGSELYVDISTIVPKPGAITTQALTSPWVMLRIPRANVSVAWFRNVGTDELIGVARRLR